MRPTRQEPFKSVDSAILQQSWNQNRPISTHSASKAVTPPKKTRREGPRDGPLCSRKPIGIVWPLIVNYDPSESSVDIRNNTPPHSPVDSKDHWISTDDDFIVSLWQKRNPGVCFTTSMPKSSLHPNCLNVHTAIDTSSFYWSFLRRPWINRFWHAIKLFLNRIQIGWSILNLSSSW